MSNEMIDKSIRFLKDVRTELTKVSWPSRADVRGATIVVIIVVLIIAFFIGLVDLVISKLENLLFVG
jgi:preprotein translocase subunit SecE